MNNVGCAGGGRWAWDPLIRSRVRAAKAYESALNTPCGWQGERFPSVPLFHSDRAAAVAFKRKATRKPCPRCSGKVALLERDDQ